MRLVSAHLFPLPPLPPRAAAGRKQFPAFHLFLPSVYLFIILFKFLFVTSFVRFFIGRGGVGFVISLFIILALSFSSLSQQLVGRDR